MWSDAAPSTDGRRAITSACIVADANDGAGWGHLSRAGGLAVALATKGVDCSAYAYGRTDAVVRDGITWRLADAVADVKQAARGASVLVLDSYELAIEQVLDEVDGVPSVVFQDNRDESTSASLTVSIAADEGGTSRRLHGPEYACLRPDFWGLPAREPRDDVYRVLVATGSGGAGDLGATLAGAVRKAVPEAAIAVVGSPVSTLASPPGVTHVTAPGSLLVELLAADIAITAGGQTMLETAATGTPCIALVTAENQRSQLTALARRGAVAELEDPRQLEELLGSLVADATRRRALSREAQSAVDGYGALRIAFEVISLLADPA